MTGRDDHLIDTPVKLGQCNRCQAYVFLAQSSGVRSAADVAPADRDAYIAAVTDGRRTFDLATQAGRPHKLLTRRLGSQPPSYDLQGRQNAAQGPSAGSTGTPGRKSVLVEHGCGGHALNMLRFVEVEKGPPPARVTPGSSHSGGPHRQAAHESGLYVEEIHRRSPAVPANRRRSEYRDHSNTGTLTPVCDVCQRRVKPGEEWWGISHGHIWHYCVHEECP